MSRRRVAAALGFAAALLAFAVPIVGAARRPGYSHVSQYISELGETGARDAFWVASAGFAPLGLLVLAFLACAAPLFPASRWRSVGVACLGAVGAAYLASAVFPCDAGCPGAGSPSQSVHNSFGLLEYLGALVGLAALAVAFRRVEAWRAVAAACVVAAVFVGVGFAGMLAPALSEVRGVSQRVAEAAIFLWIAFVSGVLVRRAG